MQRKNNASFAAASLFLLTGAVAFAAEPPAAAPAPAPAAKVEKSGAPTILEPKTIGEVYNGVGARDPFVSVLGGGGGAEVSDSSETPKPNVNNLQLRGILTGAKAKFAMIEDASSGTRFLLKEDGKIYDQRGKAVSGITGTIKSSSMVELKSVSDGLTNTLKIGDQK